MESVPQTLRQLNLQKSEISASIFSAPATVISEKVQAGKLDFGLVFAAPTIASLKVKALYPVPFVLVGAPAYVKRSSADWKLVISREQDYSKRKSFPAARLLKKANINYRVALQANDLTVQKQLILEGLRIGLLPEFFVNNEIQDGSLRKIENQESFTETIKLVTRSGWSADPLAQSF